jgi:hypothetical protein
MARRKRLHGVPPAEFTKARDALVKELKAAGDEAEAKRVASLRKPAAPLWTVNQLGARAPKEVGALIDSADKMKRAHRSGDTEALRTAMQEQREALRALDKTAEEAAAEIGSKATMDFLRRVQTTAQSAAAAQPEALREGTLDEELEAAGFETLLGTHIGAPRHEPDEQHHEPKHDAEAQRKAARELRKAEESAEQLAVKAKELEQAAVRAQDAALEARRVADEARSAARKAQELAQALRRR